MNPTCDIGGDYLANYDGTYTYQPPCTQPVTHRFQPTDPTAHGWARGSWGHRCTQHMQWLTTDIEWRTETLTEADAR